MELHVQGGRPFQCSVASCGVKFARLRYLRRHQNLTHRVADERSRECPSNVVEGAYESQTVPKPCTTTERDTDQREELAQGGIGKTEPKGEDERSADYTALRTLSLYASTARQAQ